MDTLASIFAIAGPRATACASTTCRALLAASDRQTLWRDFVVRDWSPTAAAFGSGPASTSAPRPAQNWRSLYRRWATGAPASTLLREHAPPSAAPRRTVNSLSFSGASSAPHRLFSAADDGVLLSWDPDRCARVDGADAAHAGAAITAVAAGPGSLLASAGANNAAAAWDARAPLSSGPTVELPHAHSGEVFSLAWLSPSSHGDDAHEAHGGAGPLWLATGGGDELIRIWDLRAPEACLCEVEAGSGTVYAMAWDAEASRLFAAFGRDVCVFDVGGARGAGGELAYPSECAWVSTLRAHLGDIYALSLGANCLLTAGDDGCVFEWTRPPPPPRAARAYGGDADGEAAARDDDEEDEEEPIDEEPAPVSKLEMSSWRAQVAGEASGAADLAGLSSRGGEGGRTSITSLAGLGTGPRGFLAGTWEGYVVHATRGRGRIRPFGKALLREPGPQGQEAAVPEVPVTALAASLGVVAVGGQFGEVRFMRMTPEEEEQQGPEEGS